MCVSLIGDGDIVICLGSSSRQQCAALAPLALHVVGAEAECSCLVSCVYAAAKCFCAFDYVRNVTEDKLL